MSVSSRAAARPGCRGTSLTGGPGGPTPSHHDPQPTAMIPVAETRPACGQRRDHREAPAAHGRRRVLKGGNEIGSGRAAGRLSRMRGTADPRPNPLSFAPWRGIVAAMARTRILASTSAVGAPWGGARVVTLRGLLLLTLR